MKRALFCFVLLGLIINSYAQSSMQLLKNIQAELSNQKGFFAIAFKDLQTNETLLWNEHDIFHAASTMKTPVMMEVYKQVAAGKLVLTDSVLVKNEFKSIVDGSLYSLNAADDSQQELYKLVGSKIPLSELVYQMIIMSSNLATNLIMEMVDGKKVTQTMRDLGTKNMMVLRGVEDSKAFAQNLNNTTTAYDLMVVYEQLAKGKVVSQKACDEMINTLFNQTHNTLIPALLPKNVRVAHKTGTITGVHHDSGIVFLPDGRKYVLVFLSKNLENDTEATNSMAKVSEMIYQNVMNKTK